MGMHSNAVWPCWIQLNSMDYLLTPSWKFLIYLQASGALSFAEKHYCVPEPWRKIGCTIAFDRNLFIEKIGGSERSIPLWANLWEQQIWVWHTLPEAAGEASLRVTLDQSRSFLEKFWSGRNCDPMFSSKYIIKKCVLCSQASIKL